MTMGRAGVTETVVFGGSDDAGGDARAPSAGTTIALPGHIRG